jgi:dephospho-CoA kinase
VLIPVVPYQSRWADDFRRFADALGEALGQAALRIDHIGSTSVEGLAAKPIIDIQVTVESLSAVSEVSSRIVAAGFVRREAIDCDRPPPWEVNAPEEWRKAFFRTVDGAPIRAHVHFRRQGRRNQRYALLFRDYLRANSRARAAYGAFKLQLAVAVGHLSEPGGTGPYLDLKDPMLDLIADAAETWAASQRWTPSL